MEVSTVVIIPARMGSERFPGKPLHIIEGKPMIQHAYERASAVCPTYIATSCEKIINWCYSNDVKLIITSPIHKNGTSRCIEAVETLEEWSRQKYDYVINLQSDIPFFPSDMLELIKFHLILCGKNIVTLYEPVPYTEAESADDVKIVTTTTDTALYFSRALIPFIANARYHSDPRNPLYKKHIGVYGFKRKVLDKIKLILMNPEPVNLTEDLEQLQWLVHGMKIKCYPYKEKIMSVNKPSDIKKLKT